MIFKSFKCVQLNKPYEFIKFVFGFIKLDWVGDANNAMIMDPSVLGKLWPYCIMVAKAIYPPPYM